MHDTAALTGEAFFACYPGATILDVGSMDVNGTLRPYAPIGSTYLGIDIAAGPAVDVVVEHAAAFPFAAAAFDLVVSSSCLEHDPMFWVTFAEMARVAAGFIYVSAPSNGPYHGHPGDCWRFYADSAAALAQWATRCGFAVELIETFMVAPRRDVWIDNVMVFGKPSVPRCPRITDRLAAAGGRLAR